MMCMPSECVHTYMSLYISVAMVRVTVLFIVESIAEVVG